MAISQDQELKRNKIKKYQDTDITVPSFPWQELLQGQESMERLLKKMQFQKNQTNHVDVLLLFRFVVGMYRIRIPV